MTEPKSLPEYVELASQRHNDASGRRLAEIAAASGYDVSHSTLNRIRRGTYTSRPSDATLDAIAFLAGVEARHVYAANAAVWSTDWREFEALFFQWYDLGERLKQTIGRYAALRGLSWSDASKELTTVSREYQSFRNGFPEWRRPWMADDDRDDDAPPPPTLRAVAAREEDDPKEDPA